jgi:hypothetical protein
MLRIETEGIAYPQPASKHWMRLAIVERASRVPDKAALGLGTKVSKAVTR